MKYHDFEQTHSNETHESLEITEDIPPPSGGLIIFSLTKKSVFLRVLFYCEGENEDDPQRLIDKFNIAWIKKQMKVSSEIKHTPMLVAVVQTLNAAGDDDPTCRSGHCPNF